jgi:hypothetical protein
MPNIVHVSTSLPTYIPKGFDHQPLDGRQPRDSLGGSSPKGGLLREPSFKLHVGSFRWLAPDRRMFIPP